MPAVVEIRNPLSDDQRFLRYTMLHAHLALIARDRTPRPYRTFELGHVFSDAQPEPLERNLATIVVATPKADEPAWRSGPFAAFASDLLAVVRRATGRDATLERATAPRLHPGKTAAPVLDGVRFGVFGVVDPRRTRIRYRRRRGRGGAGDRYAARSGEATDRSGIAVPGERDLALIVDARCGRQLLAAVRAAGVRAATVFDTAVPDRCVEEVAGRARPAARRLTLTDAQADETMARSWPRPQRFSAVLRVSLPGPISLSADRAAVRVQGGIRAPLRAAAFALLDRGGVR